MILPKNKDYPKELHVGCEIYRVEFCKMRDYGKCDPNKRVISIKLGLSKAETFKTFIHEVLHAMAFEGDFDLKHKVIRELEQSIFDVFVQNL